MTMWNCIEPYIAYIIINHPFGILLLILTLAGQDDA
ncbi:hypothetical protein Rctr71_048 [Virus Rctr71]|nr:hypothetical protein Rctr71_048 [Virus Rctr71]